MADALPGREQELLEADERLARLCDLHELVGRIDVFTAARGYGKTSLLREIQRRAQARGAVTSWVTAGDDRDLVSAIADGFEDSTRSWHGAAKLLPMLEQARVSVNFGVASAEATVRPRTAEPSSRTRLVEQVVRQVVDVGRRHDHRAAVILIDEAQSADPAGLRALAYAWQHLQAEGQDVPAAVFAAGLPDTSQAFVTAVSSSERFAYADLDPLDPVAVVQALSLPARRLGVEWDRDALLLAAEAAAGYPFTVQLIGDHAWKLAGRPDHGAVITAELARAACAKAASNMTRLIEDRFIRSTPAERAFMVAMAQAGDGDTPVRRGAITDQMGVPSGHVGHQRDSLLKSGLIRSAAYGTVEFTIPGMVQYLRERAEGGPRPGWNFTRSGREVLQRSRDDRAQLPPSDQTPG